MLGIELLAIWFMVYGAKQAWVNGTAAAGRSLGQFNEKTRLRLAEKPLLSRLGEWGPKVAAGTATAVVGSWLAPRAFLRDWKQNWREGRDEARRRWGTPAETVSLVKNGVSAETVNTAVPLAETPPETAAAGSPETHLKNIDEALVSFQKGTETKPVTVAQGQGAPHAYVTKEEKTMPEHWTEEAAREAAALHKQKVDAHSAEEHRVAAAATKKAEASGAFDENRRIAQAIIDGNPPPLQRTANNGTKKGSAMPATVTGVAVNVSEITNLETFKLAVDELSSYASTESESATMLVNNFDELRAKLETAGSSLKRIGGEAMSANVARARESIGVSQQAAESIRGSMDSLKAVVASMEEDVQEQIRIKEAKQAAKDSNVSSTFYGQNAGTAKVS